MDFLSKLGESNIQFSVVVGFIVTILVASISLWKYRNDKNNRRFPSFASIKFQKYIDGFVTGQVHRLHVKLCSENGLIYRLPTGTWSPFIVVHDPTIAKMIIEGDSHHGIPESDKSVRYKILTKLTKGVHTMLTKQTAEGTWESSRKAVAPSFSMMNLIKVIPELQSKLEQFNAILDAHIEQNALLIDLPEWMVRVTIDVLAASMFRTDFRTLQSHSLKTGVSISPNSSSASDVESDGQLFVRCVGIMSKEFMMRSPLQPWRKFLIWDKKVMKEIADAEIAATAVVDIGKRLLEGYRVEHTKEELEEDKSILGHLIRSPYLSDRERIADISTFMIAGHDTTAYQLSWIIIELSRNPDVVSKLRLELDALFPCRQYSNVAFTPQHLSKLNYLTSVIKEGMRLWPVAAIGTSRLVAADIPCGDKIIPKGAVASIGFFAMFRAGIRDPHDFIPGRWADTDPDAAKLKELSFPFSTGKRACIGQNLALLELKLVLATLVYSYDFELVSDVSEMYYITLKPQNANFRVSKRP